MMAPFVVSFAPIMSKSAQAPNESERRRKSRAFALSAVFTGVKAWFAAHDISSAGFWVILNAFINSPPSPELEHLQDDLDVSQLERFSRADRRKLFWDAHSSLGKMILTEQYPAFAPDHKVWKENDTASIDITEQLLTNAMQTSVIDSSMKRLWQVALVCLFVSLFLWVLYVALMLAMYGGPIGPRGAIISLLIALGITLFMLWTLMKRRANLQSMSMGREGRTDASNLHCTDDLSGLQLDEALDLGHSFADPSRLEASLAKFRTGDISASKLWLRLDRFIANHSISRTKRRQLFLDSYYQSKERLEKNCPLFSPQNSFWAEQDEAELEETDKALTRWSSFDVQRALEPSTGTKLLQVAVAMFQPLLFIRTAKTSRGSAVVLGIYVTVLWPLLISLLGYGLWRKLEMRKIERQFISAV